MEVAGMEKLSRIKKYEGLRKSIELDSPVDTSQEHVQETKTLDEKNLKFDSTLLKRVDIKEQNETTAKRAKIDELNSGDSNPVNDTFTNEYLDDFIKEVRDYNIRKGNRETDNTQADILYQLNATNRAKRSRYIQEINEDFIEPEKTIIQHTDIAAEIQNLIHQEEIEQAEFDQQSDEFIHADDDEETLFPKDNQTTVIEPPVKKVLTPMYVDYDESDITNNEPLQETEQNTVFMKVKQFQQNEIIEETKQLRVQIDEYEDELTDLSDGVEKTNKLLNFVLCFLILVLLAVIGFIAYGIWKAGGFR